MARYSDHATKQKLCNGENGTHWNRCLSSSTSLKSAGRSFARRRHTLSTDSKFEKYPTRCSATWSGVTPSRPAKFTSVPRLIRPTVISMSVARIAVNNTVFSVALGFASAFGEAPESRSTCMEARTFRSCGVKVDGSNGPRQIAGSRTDGSVEYLTNEQIELPMFAWTVNGASYAARRIDTPDCVR